ncbi:MAG: ABC transporter ATP-binding protein [Actinomycetota bacterium]
MADRDVLRVEGLYKRFGAVVALDGFDLRVRRGALMALLGPSGCGKTTALRVIAGFERPEGGKVWVGDRLATGEKTLLPPERRRIGMVFQDWALFPHLDVWGNVAFGLPRGRQDRLREVLGLVDLVGMERRMPHELSGGQQQRVALARALAPGPEVILLDEPFSNLDAALRARVRAEVRAVLRRASATAVFVTHDQEEALSVADELAVMEAGRVLQVGTPEEVYAAPASRRVAGLLGDANFFPGRVEWGRVATPLGVLPAGDGVDGPAEVMIRPEWVRVEPDPDGQCVVSEVEFYGHDHLVRVDLPDGSVLRSRAFGLHPELRPGTRVRVRVDAPPTLFPRELSG